MAPGQDDGPLGFGEDDREAAERARRERIARRQDPDLVAEGVHATGERQPQPPARLARGISRYGWFVGVVGVLLILTIILATDGRDGPGAQGLAPGGPAPPFAAPLATSPLAKADDNDVNIAVKTGQGDAGAVPACSVRRPDVLNLCALYEARPVVLAFFTTRSPACVTQLDRLDDAARRHPEVAFAAVSIKGDVDAIRRLVAERRWTFPLGYDDDGILATAYGVAICPQVTFIRRGGTIAETSLGQLDANGLERRIRALATGVTGATGASGGG